LDGGCNIKQIGPDSLFRLLLEAEAYKEFLALLCTDNSGRNGIVSTLLALKYAFLELILE
jgi:hypothetical protein